MLLKFVYSLTCLFKPYLLGIESTEHCIALATVREFIRSTNYLVIIDNERFGNVASLTWLYLRSVNQQGGKRASGGGSRSTDPTGTLVLCPNLFIEFSKYIF